MRDTRAKVLSEIIPKKYKVDIVITMKLYVSQPLTPYSIKAQDVSMKPSNLLITISHFKPTLIVETIALCYVFINTNP